MEDRLIHFISQQFLLDRVTLVGRLETKGTRIAFRITADGGEFVVKLTPPDREVAQLQRDVDVLRYLAEADFPAPRLLQTRNGSWFVPFEGRFLTLYRYIQGHDPKPDGLLFEKLGDLLAQLHSLPLPLGDYPSDYRPETELPRVKEALLHLPGSKDKEIASDLIKNIDDFPLFDSLPMALIHGDPWFTNIVQTARGDLSLIDWDDAGLSYPILDVGYVIAALCSFAPPDQLAGSVAETPEIAWHPDWASVFLASYQRRRPLSIREIRFLPQAVKFSLLVYMVDWAEPRIFPGNYLRLKLFESQVLTSVIRQALTRSMPA